MRNNVPLTVTSEFPQVGPLFGCRSRIVVTPSTYSKCAAPELEMPPTVSLTFINDALSIAGDLHVAMELDDMVAGTDLTPKVQVATPPVHISPPCKVTSCPPLVAPILGITLRMWIDGTTTNLVVLSPKSTPFVLILRL